MKDKRFDEISIQSDDTIINALKKMDRTNRKLLLVYNKEKYVGLLSIGDIQRAIIKNNPFFTPISEILRKNIVVCRNDESFEEIKSKILRYRTECMPVLDNENNLKDVIFWEDIFYDETRVIRPKLDIPAVIMAGGLGTRLKPLTNVIPKALVPIGEKTIMENIIERFCAVGVKRFLVTVNFKHEMIEFYFNNLVDKKYDISFYLEEAPLGTAGSLRLLDGKIESTFFVNNCDIIIDQDYRDIYQYHIDNKNDITLVAATKNYSIPYGIVESGKDGLLTDIQEKPEYMYLINSGMYLLEPYVLNKIPKGEIYHITQLISQIRNSGGRVGVFPVTEKSWFDIGEWDSYQNTLLEYNKRFMYRRKDIQSI